MPLPIPRGPSPERRFRAATLGSALAVLAAAACDIPTDPPELESRWQVPVEETRFGVGELLTEGEVDFNPDSSAFVVTVDPVQAQASVAELCALCSPALDGETVPKPPFLETVQAGLIFPASVASFSLEGGSVEIVLDNGLNFDPIRPGAGATGSVTLEIRDSADGEVLGASVLDGVSRSLPPGTSLTETVDLAPGSVEGNLVLDVVVNSPAGDLIVLDRSLTFSATATPMNVEVSEVSVDVSNRAVTLEPVALDAEDLEAEIVERIVEGALVLDLANPFGVSADFTLEIAGPTISTLTRSFTVPGDPTSTTRVDYTGAELQSFLGEPGVTFQGSALVNSGAGFIRVTPGEELVLEASLDMTLRVGG